MCYDCDKIQEVNVTISCCDYIPNGLNSELANHPTFKDGSITCGDFQEDIPEGAKPCHPTEFDWDEETDLSIYEDYQYRCSVCDTLNLECQI